MNCKIDHTPAGFPAFLCRICHPELIPTEEKRQEYALRARAALERESLRQELLRTQQKISSMSREGEPDPCFVPVKARIYGSLQRKAARLHAKLEEQHV